MHTGVLSLLCCPDCHGKLHVTNSGGGGHARAVTQASTCGSELQSGLLGCECGATYPIVQGVPLLLDRGLRGKSSTVHCQKEELKPWKSSGKTADAAITEDNEGGYESIRRSFSREWEMFDYERDKTWGWTLNERRAVFLDDTGLTEVEASGKVLLDAGCGNGTLTATLATLGMEVVGVDLNNGLAAINSRKARFAGENAPHVNFVQANLANPPFKRDVFDLIYCSGVIHHTPNSRQTFGKLVPLLKRGGRLYVWVYARRSIPVRAFFGCGRRLKTFMSLRSLLTICRLLAPVYKIGTELLNFSGVMPFRKRSTREITLDLFDALAPQYNHWHMEDEVQSWFREAGFLNIAVSGRQKHGFGVYGDKA